MSFPFDATLKELVRRYPLDWLAGLELDVQLPIRALDVDVSTVSAGADTVLGIGDPLSSLIQIEFQSSRDASLPRRLLVYNGLLHERFAVPVHSAVVLLRRQADEPALNGRLSYETQRGRAGIEFRFEVVRIWQRPATELLTGGLGMVPLAPLGELPTDSTPEAALKELLRRIDERLEAELSPADAKRLMVAAWVLTGMRVPGSALSFVEEALDMVDLRDSSTYQLIIEEGMAKCLQQGIAQGREEGITQGLEQGREQGLEQGREQGLEQGREQGLEQGREQGMTQGVLTMLLDFGAHRLGPPAAAVRESLGAIDDVERLRRMGARVLVVANWQELLDTP